MGFSSRLSVLYVASLTSVSLIEMNRHLPIYNLLCVDPLGDDEEGELHVGVGFTHGSLTTKINIASNGLVRIYYNAQCDRRSSFRSLFFF